ncbi:unnamed protein product [Mytilus coruscus]|uniref:Uncharacterized protein n=1 Tax=Mytilus coruscus TaxID=42192 RepID=A0A6J8BXT8_MYTCO|nr:unnamed protein product [Mytilus coruscus]
MAQVLAVPGDVRHGFSYICHFNHDFGRITGIAATIKGNILLCDYDKKNLILVDPLGNYLKKLNVDSEPYDVAITSQNIGYITQPNSRTVLQIDPDKMIVLFKDKSMFFWRKQRWLYVCRCCHLRANMAQMLAVPGDVSHGFSYYGQFNHDFGRITEIAATVKGNILLCDYYKKNLILVDPLGNYLKNLYLDSEPYGVAITSQNIGYVTQPHSRSVLQIDPDSMVVLFQASCNELGTTVFCVLAVSKNGRCFSHKVPCYLGVKIHGLAYAFPVNHEEINIKDVATYGYKIRACILKFHTVNEDSWFSCIGGQHYITFNEKLEYRIKIINIATIDAPNDICSDHNGHIYVNGQGSNNIHRLKGYIQESLLESETTVWKVLDIPLDAHHGIKEPVALCFNKDYSKLYIVNERGKSVLVLDVI